jgi:hypothetical protein
MQREERNSQRVFFSVFLCSALWCKERKGTLKESFFSLFVFCSMMQREERNCLLPIYHLLHASPIISVSFNSYVVLYWNCPLFTIHHQLLEWELASPTILFQFLLIITNYRVTYCMLSSQPNLTCLVTKFLLSLLRIPYIWLIVTSGSVKIQRWSKNKFIFEQLRQKQSNSCLEVCS